MGLLGWLIRIIKKLFGYSGGGREDQDLSKGYGYDQDARKEIKKEKKKTKSSKRRSL